jgi:hypothetical protein
MRDLKRTELTLAALLLAACSGAVEPTPDAGGNDNARPDAGAVDAGPSPWLGLVINEVAPAGAPSDWFELYNPTDAALTLAGLTYTDDPAGAPGKATFPAGAAVPPRGFYVQYLTDADPGFGLGADEALGLFDPQGNLLDSVDWEAGAAPAASSYGRFPDGTGAFETLAIPTPGASNQRGAPVCGDGARQGVEQCDGVDVGGTTCEGLGLGPGRVACNSTCDGFDTSGCAAITSLLVINELTASGDDQIELYLTGGAAVDLGGYRLEDAGGGRYDFTAGTVMTPDTYLVLVKGTHHSFGLGAGGDSVALYDAAGLLVDSATYAAGLADVSYCRLPNGRGPFQACAVATFGAENSDVAPTCGDDVRAGAEVCDGSDLAGQDCLTQGFSGGALGCNPACDGFDTSGCLTTTATTVVLNEVTSSGDDQIELLNTTAGIVDLAGWMVADDGYVPGDATTVDHLFVLPAGRQIDPGEHLVLVKGVDHAFGLGGSDAVRLFDATGALRSQVAWPSGAAATSYCRRPDGVGPWQACPAATFGAANP